METLCGPYSASLGIKHKCYSQFYLALVPAVVWICGFLLECFLKRRLKALPGKVPDLLLGLLCLLIGGYFALLSLELFYIDIPTVALIDVLTYLVEVILWMLVMFVYQKSFNPQSWGFTSYDSLQLFYIVQSAVLLFQLILWISNLGNPQELRSGEFLNEESLVTWLQLWPWVADILLMGYLVSGWVAARSSWMAAQYQSLAASSPHWFDGVSIYSKLTIMWINSLMLLGRLRPLTQNDLDDLRNEEEVSEHDKLFKAQLDIYLHKPGVKRPMLKAIYARFKTEIIRITAFGVTTTIMDYIGSFYILVVANYLTSDQPTWRGYALVSYLLLFKIIQGISNTQFRFQVQLFSLHLKAAISTQIYNKSLKATTIAKKASGEATEKTTYAEVTNLMQVDLERLAMGLPYSLRAVIFPFQIGIGVYMMFATIGTAGSFAALGTMVFFFIINGIISKKVGTLMKLMMEKKDGRMKYCVELLANIKVLKLYNWEQKIADRIGTARTEEVRVTKTLANYFNFLVFLNWGTRNYLIIAIVLTMSILGEPLSPGHIFAGITVIGILNMGIRFLPDILNNFMQMLVSMKRIEDYLKSQEVQDYNDKEKGKQTPELAASLVDASFSWSSAAPKAEEPDLNPGGELSEVRVALQDVTLSIRKGEFVAVVGRVGSGKSSLLQGLIGNMNFIKRSPDSSMFINGSIAYVSQEAWIQNLTIKDNILFGNPMQIERYQTVLDICELNNDLQVLPGGDLTEIGEKGINLSGGQKARVAIARAIYSDADVLLMDDPLSALDAHVGKSIYSRCLSQFCAGKTRILTTHGQQYLPNVDRIIVIKEGKVVEVGTYQELLALDGYFKNEFLVNAHEYEPSSVTASAEVKEESGKEKTESKIIETEDKAVGSVSFSVYKDYYNYMGGCKTLTGVLIAMLCWQGSRMYADIYLSEWTEESPEQQDQMVVTNNLIFGLASFILNLFILVRLLLTTHTAIHASQVIFSKVIKALTDAPVNKYYDITPNGRILNRLSKDQGLIDAFIIMIIGGFIGQAFTVVLVISMCAYAIPYLLLLIPVLVYVSLKVQKLYLCSSRELTRLESISRSPIIQLFSETVSGASGIRAFGYQTRFVERNTTCLNDNMKISFYLAAVNAWLTMFLELISDLVLSICAFAIVSFRGNMGIGMAGMALSYALSLPENFYWLVFTSAGLENAMVAVERTDALTRIPSEQPRVRHKDEQLIARNWPERGEISFNNFQLKYRDETELVLLGITAHIQSHEKIGIVGRTGSGKSSLCLALFRIVEAYAGTITIDNVDISEVGLDLLRQKMSVIPQDPTLFRGKLRDNFDPFHTVSDEFLIKSITDLNMFPDKNLEEVLKMDVQENGENFSVGERQLICILRAILRHTKIMFLDEATASIDYRTDQLIQSIIRERFRECTVLTIAHRINTIMDYDRVMVMEKGVIVEFDKPSVLRTQDSYFSRLVAQSRL